MERPGASSGSVIKESGFQHPWDRINPGDIIYFKDSGEPVTIRAEVVDARQFSGLTPLSVRNILDKYGKDDGLRQEDIPVFYDMFRHKRYCILVFLGNPQSTEPFDIDKAGFGMMSSWITIEDISRIRK